MKTWNLISTHSFDCRKQTFLRFWSWWTCCSVSSASRRRDAFFFLRDAVFLDASCHPVGWNARFATKIKSIDTGLYLLCAKKKKCTVFLHPSTHRQVSLSWRRSEAVKHCSQSTEPFSSFLRDSSSALPLVREYFSSLLMCLLRKAKPEIQRKKESVLNPSVRPRYNILQKKPKKTTENMLIWGVQKVALHLSS